ncbi:P-loop containing nucleoside triphosphate hydrolase protein [Infundibulicybe gibba]|nr:P-loop containing nucleoside triphosphate hydrolase protein [Infundibulicybe gibba]
MSGSLLSRGPTFNKSTTSSRLFHTTKRACRDTPEKSNPNSEDLDALHRRRKTEWKRKQGGQTFLDYLVVNIRGGSGGNGCAAFHREKFKPFGPPSGGNGGRGGDVYILPTPHMTTLSSIPKRIRGEMVPLGTVVRELPRDDPRQKRDKMRDNRWVHYPRFGAENVERDSFKEAEASVYKQERERRFARRKRALEEPIFLDLDKEEDASVSVDAPLGIRQPENLGHLIASAVNRSPKFATRGHEGERITLSLELKLLADIGLVGMPNAGKSTLLRALTGGRAKSEVAGYAFTTLNPVVGVVRVAEDGTFEGGLSGAQVHDETILEEERESERMRNGEYAEALTRNQVPRTESSIAETGSAHRAGHNFDIAETFRFTIADNPGLISRASENVGLGHSFLRSMERSLALAYVVDLSGPSPWEELRILREELEKYQPGMSTKARMVIANKADLLAADGNSLAVEAAKEKLRRLEEYVREDMAVDASGVKMSLDVLRHLQNSVKIFPRSLG